MTDFRDDFEFDDDDSFGSAPDAVLSDSEADGAAKPKKATKFLAEEERVFGMTAVQRLFLATMLFLNLCILGFFCNYVFGRFYIPNLPF